MLESLSNDNDDGGENIVKKKIQFASFQTLSRLFDPLNF